MKREAENGRGEAQTPSKFNGAKGTFDGKASGDAPAILSNGLEHRASDFRDGREAAVINKEETRKHLEIISAHVTKLAEPLIAEGRSPGRLQLVFDCPVDDNTVHYYQYEINNIDDMLKDAIAYANIGWNVYVEGRTVRSDVRVGRGELKDTVFVWAWFIDDDADKGRASEVNVKASLLVEFSPGNSHTWILPNRWIPPRDAKELGHMSDVYQRTRTGVDD